MATVAHRVLRALEAGPLDDDQLAAHLGIRRQHVNQVCRRLAEEGLITRGSGSGGKILNRLVAKPSPAPPVRAAARSPASDWYWEGNVQAAIARSLVRQGWEIVRQADTASMEQGIDLVARRGGRTLAVEVKGYPLTTYARGPRAGQPKPTAPTLQARHWFAGAILSAMVLRTKMPEAGVALGLPDFPRYRSLLSQTEESLRRLGVGVYLVDATGSVTEYLSADEREAP